MKKVEESRRPEQPRVRREGEERGESNNVVWFIEKMRGRAGGRIESIRGSVSVRSQRSGQGGFGCVHRTGCRGRACRSFHR